MKTKFLGIFLQPSTVDSEITKLKRRLENQPRKVPGNINFTGWDIDYVDNFALISSLEILVQKGWNDFLTENESPLILDCGANIGISVLNYRRKYPSAKIIAFEPDPTILPVLKRNLKNNQASDVSIVEAAVWINSGEMAFYLEGADGSKLVTSSSDETIKVKTVDLREYVNTPVDLLKMDIEGAELDVIPHIKEKLELVKNLIVECHINGDLMGRFGALLQTLSGAGFKVSINSMGVWRDLVRNPIKLPNEFDQYFLVTAWRGVL